MYTFTYGKVKNAFVFLVYTHTHIFSVPYGTVCGSMFIFYSLDEACSIPKRMFVFEFYVSVSSTKSSPQCRKICYMSIVPNCQKIRTVVRYLDAVVMFECVFVSVHFLAEVCI